MPLLQGRRHPKISGTIKFHTFDGIPLGIADRKLRLPEKFSEALLSLGAATSMGAECDDEKFMKLRTSL